VTRDTSLPGIRNNNILAGVTVAGLRNILHTLGNHRALIGSQDREALLSALVSMISYSLIWLFRSFAELLIRPRLPFAGKTWSNAG
jgi:hypothetical protein